MEGKEWNGMSGIYLPYHLPMFVEFTIHNLE